MSTLSFTVKTQAVHPRQTHRYDKNCLTYAFYLHLLEVTMYFSEIKDPRHSTYLLCAKWNIRPLCCVANQGPVSLEGPEKFSGPESHNKMLTLKFTELFFSHNFNMNKGNFHAKFNAYTLLSFRDTDH